MGPDVLGPYHTHSSSQLEEPFGLNSSTRNLILLMVESFEAICSVQKSREN